MAKQQLSALHHCVFSLQYHLVLVTKYRRKVISSELKKRLGQIFADLLKQWEGELIEFNGEADHVHLLFSIKRETFLVGAGQQFENCFLSQDSQRIQTRDFKGLLETRVLASFILLAHLRRSAPYRDTAVYPATG